MAAEFTLEEEALKRREKLKALREKSILANQVKFLNSLQYFSTHRRSVMCPLQRCIIYVFRQFRGSLGHTVVNDGVMMK